MSDVVRFARDLQEVVYTVGPDSVRKAILAFLEDEHNASFAEDTAVRFCAGGSIAVTTLFSSSGLTAQGIEARQRRDAKQLDPEGESPVAKPCAQSQSQRG